MHDFIGQPIEPGCWLATGAKGNTSAEYGMILHKVESVGTTSFKAKRLTVRYVKTKSAFGKTTFVAKVTYRMATFKSPNKFVRMDPPQPVRELFSVFEFGIPTQEAHEMVGKWLHGQEQDLFA